MTLKEFEHWLIDNGFTYRKHYSYRDDPRTNPMWIHKSKKIAISDRAVEDDPGESHRWIKTQLDLIKTRPDLISPYYNFD